VVSLCYLLRFCFFSTWQPPRSILFPYTTLFRSEAVKREENQLERVDFLSVIEENILKILLNYGDKVLTFEDYKHVKTSEEDIELKVIRKDYKVCDRIYLSLQEDELEFSNERFRAVYNHVMSYLQAHEVFDKEKFISETPQELIADITDLYMSED